MGDEESDTTSSIYSLDSRAISEEETTAKRQTKTKKTKTVEIPENLETYDPTLFSVHKYLSRLKVNDPLIETEKTVEVENQSRQCFKQILMKFAIELAVEKPKESPLDLLSRYLVKDETELQNVDIETLEESFI